MIRNFLQEYQWSQVDFDLRRAGHSRYSIVDMLAEEFSSGVPSPFTGEVRLAPLNWQELQNELIDRKYPFTVAWFKEQPSLSIVVCGKLLSVVASATLTPGTAVLEQQ